MQCNQLWQEMAVLIIREQYAQFNGKEWKERKLTSWLATCDCYYPAMIWLSLMPPSYHVSVGAMCNGGYLKWIICRGHKSEDLLSVTLTQQQNVSFQVDSPGDRLAVASLAAGSLFLFEYIYIYIYIYLFIFCCCCRTGRGRLFGKKCVPHACQTISRMPLDVCVTQVRIKRQSNRKMPGWTYRHPRVLQPPSIHPLPTPSQPPSQTHNRIQFHMNVSIESIQIFNWKNLLIAIESFLLFGFSFAAWIDWDWELLKRGLVTRRKFPMLTLDWDRLCGPVSSASVTVLRDADRQLPGAEVKGGGRGKGRGKFITR